MKLIIYVTHSNLNVYEVRVRTSAEPHMHQLVAGHLETLEDSMDLAYVYEQGAQMAGAETVLCIHGETMDMSADFDEYPTYLSVMMNNTFDIVWEAIK